ncbi:hypothetical protein [Streptomyces sp. NPDC001594]|uniref:hypothetical protein n=1 Tax=Streptomyces sp. NPDC001594 TaxID=3364590 RepID=UPI0036B2C4FB
MLILRGLRALTTWPGSPAPDLPRVPATLARSRSTTTPTGAAPGEPAVPAHQQDMISAA